MSSFQEAARSFETKVEAVMRQITESVLPLQRKSYECCVSCFDRKGDDLEAVGRCIQDCQSPAEVFGDKLRQEMQTFQNQISGCQQICHNKFSMSFNNADSGEQRNSIQTQMETCAAACFTESLPQLVEIKQRMLELIKKQSDHH